MSCVSSFQECNVQALKIVSHTGVSFLLCEVECKKIAVTAMSFSFIKQFLRLHTCNIILLLMHEVLILTNVDLLPGVSRVKKMKTGRLVLQVTLSCCLFSKCIH